ncbi:MAG: hypothetical protein H6567_04380 [Lewinellaceae bacterium]|nr:hypothetical protein [Lewinellaceae bacterium]
MASFFSIFLLTSCGKESPKLTQDEIALNSILSNRSEIIGDACFDDEKGSCQPTKHVFEHVFLPDYPDCDLTVEIMACVIDAGFGVEIIASDYHITNLTSCPELLGDIADLVLNEETPAGQLNEFITKIDYQVFTKLEDHFYARFGKNNDCGQNGGTFVVEYVRTACQSVCLYELIQDDPRGPTGDGDGSRNVKVSGFIKTPCDTDGCCLRHTDICYDPIHNMLVKTTSSNVIGQDPFKPCEGGLNDLPILPTGYKLVSCSPCLVTCDQ